MSTPEDLIAACEPDFVIVLGRHDEMPALAASVAQAGVPLILEKPCAVSASALRPVVDLVSQMGLFAAVPLVNRFRDIWQEEDLRRGRPKFGHFRIVTGSLERYRAWGAHWMLDPMRSGGGALRNIGIHAVDAFLVLAGTESAEVIGAFTREHPDHPGIDIHTLGLLAADAAFGVVEAGYTFPDDGSADVEWRIESDDQYVRDRNTRYEAANRMGVASIERVEEPSRYIRFAVDLRRRLETGEDPDASLEDAYRALRVIDAIYASTRESEDRQ